MNKNILFFTLILSFTLYSCVPVVVGTAATKVGTLASEDRTAGDALDDTTIWTSIKKGFFEKGFHELFTKIRVQVLEGRVLMTGEVDSSENIRQALDVAWSRQGVKEVLNELKIAKRPTNKLDIEQYTIDTWITGRIKSKMLLDGDIKSVNYSILTDNNVVYIFGIARSEEEMEKVCSISAKIRGVDKVVSHVRVKDSEERLNSLKSYKD
jgi:osmotically-inducible protein OsmY